MALTGEMAKVYSCCSCSNNWMSPPSPSLPIHPHQFTPKISNKQHHKQSTITTFAANSGGFSLNSIFKKCENCEGKGAIECPGCKIPNQRLEWNCNSTKGAIECPECKIPNQRLEWNCNSTKGAIECPGCKGTGRNKKNGNIFERWKCFDCQGFGLKSCPSCGKGGLTPEQRGER